MSLVLTLLNNTFTIYRLRAEAKIPGSALNSPFFNITRTADELSILLPDTVEIQDAVREPGWSCFKVKGPLDFDLVGILAEISSALAESSVPLFALSTFETDYILVKRKQAQHASEALIAAGFMIERERS
jgi:hypothetical protein